MHSISVGVNGVYSECDSSVELCVSDASAAVVLYSFSVGSGRTASHPASSPSTSIVFSSPRADVGDTAMVNQRLRSLFRR
jgi:hypothetical protein